MTKAIEGLAIRITDFGSEVSFKDGFKKTEMVGATNKIAKSIVENISDNENNQAKLLEILNKDQSVETAKKILTSLGIVFETHQNDLQNSGKKRSFNDSQFRSLDGESGESSKEISGNSDIQVRDEFKRQKKLADTAPFAIKIDDAMVRSTLSAYRPLSAKYQSKYLLEEENSITTDFREGAKYLQNELLDERVNIQRAIRSFETACLCASPETTLFSRHNLIVIYKNNKLNQESAVQHDNLMTAIRQGLQQIKDFRNNAALVNFNVGEEGSQELDRTIAAIYANAMDQWGSFTAEEKNTLTDEVFNEISRNEIFLEIVDEPFYRNVLPSLLKGNTQQKIVEKLKERKVLNENYNSRKHLDNFREGLVSAAPVLLIDIYMEQFKKEQTPENLSMVLAEINTFCKKFNDSSSLKGLVVRYFDLFNSATDPVMKSKIVADAVARCNNILDKFELQAYSLNRSAKNSFSSFAMADMMVFHLLHGGTIKAELCDKVLYQLSGCIHIIKNNYFQHGSNISKEEYDDEQKDFLYRTACQAASLIIDTRNKLPTRTFDKINKNNVFNELSDFLESEFNSLKNYSLNKTLSEDTFFTPQNRELQRHIQNYMK